MNKKKRKKTSHTVSPECADLHQTTELWWVNTFECSCLLLQFTIKWKRNCHIDYGSYTQENIECSKYQLIFVTAEEVLTAEKSTASPFHLSSLRGFYFLSIFFCHRKVLPVFKLTHFDWLPTHFRKCSDTQLISGTF